MAEGDSRTRRRTGSGRCKPRSPDPVLAVAAAAVLLAGGIGAGAGGGGGAARAQTDMIRVTLDDRLAIERRTADDPWRHEERRGPDGRLVLAPADARARALWEGSGAIRTLPPPPQPAPVTLRIDLRTSAPAAALSLGVAESRPQMRPMLGRRSDPGCGTPAPRFWLENAGWGRVDDATLTLRFRNGGVAGPEQTLALGGFDARLEVDLSGALVALGLDPAAIAAACGPDGDPGDCDAALAQGPAAPLVHSAAAAGLRPGAGDDAPIFRYLAGSGSLRYAWTDAAGRTRVAAQPVGVTVVLALMQPPPGPPEADIRPAPAPVPPAASRPPSPPVAGLRPRAPDIQGAALKPAELRYSVPLALRGNPETRERTVLAGLVVPRSSTHQFTARARLADGKALTSVPITAHLLVPRPLPPLSVTGGCSLPPGIFLPAELSDPLPHPDDLRAGPAGDRP